MADPFLTSQYDIDTIADIDPSSWDLFREDLQALLAFFENAPNLIKRPTITGAVKSWQDSVQVPFWGAEIALCRTRGMTTIRNKFEVAEDLLLRAMIALYVHHGQGKTAVFASGSHSAWDAAKTLAEKATNRAGVGSTQITVDSARLTGVANHDARAYASIYDGDLPPLTPAINTRLANEQRWFF